MGISNEEFAKGNKNFEEEINEEIAELIFKIIIVRKKKNISQKELAKLANLPQNTVSRIETLTTSPTLGTFIKICKALDLKVTIE